MAKVDETRTAYLAELLLYLLPVSGPGYSYPAREALFELAEMDKAFVFSILKKHLKSIESSFSVRIWHLAGDIVRTTGFAPNESFDLAMAHWDNLESATNGSDAIRVEVGKFIISAEQRGIGRVPEKLRSEIVATVEKHHGRRF